MNGDRHEARLSSDGLDAERLPAGLVARRTGSLGHGILAAVCSAMLCVLTTITLGFLLLYTSLPHLEHDLLNDPAWLHSGWSDLRAFAIANTFFAAFTHLLVALLIGVVVGAIGGGLGMLRKERTSARATAL